MIDDAAGTAFPNLLLALSVFVGGAASPGPATLMIARVAAGQGRRAAVVLALGIVAGSVVWGCVAALGFAAALKTSAVLFTVMKLVGGAYLLFLAVKSLRAAWRRDEREVVCRTDGSGAPGKQFCRGLLLHLTNPKAPLVWMATLSVGLGASASTALPFTAVALCAGAATLVFVGYAHLFSTRSAMATYRALRRPIDCVAGLLFGAAGATLVTLKAE